MPLGLSKVVKTKIKEMYLLPIHFSALAKPKENYQDLNTPYIYIMSQQKKNPVDIIYYFFLESSKYKLASVRHIFCTVLSAEIVAFSMKRVLILSVGADNREY